jgi:hypothetical protein
MRFKRGTMILSLDLELCWGRFDKVPIPILEADSSEERIQIKRLLSLLDLYKMCTQRRPRSSRHSPAPRILLVSQELVHLRSMHRRSSVTRMVCARHCRMDQDSSGTARDRLAFLRAHLLWRHRVQCGHRAGGPDSGSGSGQIKGYHAKKLYLSPQ